MELERLQRGLEYRFRDPALLRRALTHRSAGSRNNERLEFLGDAILGCEVAENLFRLHPEATEGELSRARAQLVKRETLARVARRLELGEHLILGAGELRSGGQNRDSILSDAVEAIIAAVYLDGGMEAARGLVRRLLQEEIAASAPTHQPKDAKTRLQELLQSRSLELPRYEVTDRRGEAHHQQFTVACHVPALDLESRGTGRSRKKAEQQAAEAMLGLIETREEA